jgi:hypothetical protein
MAVKLKIIRQSAFLDASKADEVIESFTTQVNNFLAPIPQNKVRSVDPLMRLGFSSHSLTLLCYIIYES